MTDHYMDYRKIEYFLKVSEKLSFTEAAKELYITPQALTQQIAALEDELGTKLFIRNTRSVSLTECGKYCYGRFAPVRAVYQKALNDVGQYIAKAGNTIRIGFFNGLPKNEIVTPLLSLIQGYFPELEYEIISTEMDTLWKYLEDDRIDLCITNIDSSFQDNNYELEILETSDAKIVVSLTHPWVMKETVSEEDMAEADILLLRSDNSVNRSLPYDRISCRDSRTVSDFDSMLTMLDGGNYFAVFPMTFEYIKLARFKYFDLPDNIKFSFNTVCAAKRNSQSKALEKVMDLIRNEYGKQRGF